MPDCLYKAAPMGDKADILGDRAVAPLAPEFDPLGDSASDPL